MEESMCKPSVNILFYFERNSTVSFETREVQITFPDAKRRYKILLPVDLHELGRGQCLITSRGNCCREITSRELKVTIEKVVDIALSFIPRKGQCLEATENIPLILSEELESGSKYKIILKLEDDGLQAHLTKQEEVSELVLGLEEPKDLAQVSSLNVGDMTPHDLKSAIEGLVINDIEADINYSKEWLKDNIEEASKWLEVQIQNEQSLLMLINELEERGIKAKMPKSDRIRELKKERSLLIKKIKRVLSKSP